LIGHTGLAPRQDVHPDLCVALGAGVLASRLSGHSIERVLVDVSPYSFGISYLGDRGGVPYPHCYRSIIRRNIPLPLTRTESYCTSYPYQTEAEIHVYQGEDEDALKNILVGDFHIDGLTPVDEPNELLCRMRLDLDGILEVTAVEKRTGKSKHVTIANATRAKSPKEIEAGRRRIRELYQRQTIESYDEEVLDVSAVEEDTAGEKVVSIDTAASRADRATADLLDRSRRLLDKMHAEDREEAINLNERIESALQSHDAAELAGASLALRELLFFVEGQAG
jgi:molecular chaperone DnaK (HSP70)